MLTFGNDRGIRGVSATVFGGYPVGIRGYPGVSASASVPETNTVRISTLLHVLPFSAWFFKKIVMYCT